MPGSGLRIAYLFVFGSIAVTPMTVGTGQTLAGRPSGWSVIAAPAEPALTKLSDEQLIDLLQEAKPSATFWRNTRPIDSFWAIGGVVNLGGGAFAVPVHSPAAVELVRRGWGALPALLQHLTDARPTRLVYVVREPAPGKGTAPAFSDEYDPRVRSAADVVPGVNTGERLPLNEGGTYTFKVGDLCYAMLGQIVNRNLRAVRCAGEDAVIISGIVSANPGDWFMTINSPVARPALAAAARADWGGIDMRQHAESLRADVRKPVRKQPLDPGALTRLLYYYPDAGTEVAVALLRRKLIEPAAASKSTPSPADENTVGFWEQGQFVPTLAPFRSDSLQAALLEQVRQAAVIAAADLRAQPPGTWDPSIPSLGSDLALACAKQLIHQGHDDELKAILTARVAAIEAADKPELALDPNRGAERLVNHIQAQNCHAFIAEMDGAAPSTAARSLPADATPPVARGNVRLAPVSLSRSARNLVVAVEPVDPAPDRVFVGRVIIDRAQDDVGVTLWQDHVPLLAPASVGRTSDAELMGLPKATLSATLTRPAPRAKSLISLEGRVEMVVPDLDPDAVVVVTDIAGKLGAPLDSKALRAAGVSITIGDQRMAKEGAGGTLHLGPPEEESRLFNGHPPTLTLKPGDVALTISDPQERFLNVEFRGSAGKPLRYNHNGWWHSGGRGARLDVYRLGDEIPPGTQMIVWLKTDKAFLVEPLNVANLALPKPAAVGN